MKNLKKLTALVISSALAVSLASCAGDLENMKQGYSVDMNNSTKLAATNASDVKLVYKDDPSAKLPCDKYDQLGQINVQTSGAVGFAKSLTDINQDLKNGAAAQGGDAVMNIDKSMFEYSGYIIKCK
jgi:uncharacterized lipoprotein YehR (DUF1307 family)